MMMFFGGRVRVVGLILVRQWIKYGRADGQEGKTIKECCRQAPFFIANVGVRIVGVKHSKLISGW